MEEAKRSEAVLKDAEKGAGLTEIQSIVNQEEHWIGIIKSKLTQVRPNTVIVEKDIGYIRRLRSWTSSARRASS